MDFGKFDSCSIEYLTLRLVNYILNSNGSKDRTKAYKYLLTKLKELKVWPILTNEICKMASNDISGDLVNEIVLDKPSTDSLEAARQYFLQKNEPFVVNKILKYFDEYYRIGVFSEIITIIVRFMSILKAGLNKEEFHQILIKFTLACVIKNQLDVALAEIAKLKGNFDYYDTNIYLFFIRVLNGTSSINDIQGIGCNIFPEIYEKLLDKEDLSFYCLLAMLTNFKYQTYSNIMNNTSLIINRLIENDSENFEILNYYSKHNLGKVAKIYNDNIQPKIYRDILFCKHQITYNLNLKSDILSQIIKSSSIISTKQLSDLIYDDENNVEKIAINLIKRGLPYRIDRVKNQIIQLSENKNETEFENIFEKVKLRNENILWNRVFQSLSQDQTLRKLDKSTIDKKRFKKVKEV